MNRVDELWRRRDVPASAKLIFALIHYYAEEKEDGIVRPTAEVIGEETGLIVRTVREGLKVLWERGFIEREATKERCNIAGWQVVRQKLPNQDAVTPANVAEPKRVVRQKLPNQSGKSCSSTPAKVAEPSEEGEKRRAEEEKNKTPAAATSDGQVIGLAGNWGKEPKPKAKKKSGGGRNLHAEAFRARHDSDGRFSLPYDWHRADFVQLDRWLKKYPDVTPEEFADFAERCWDSGKDFIRGQALTIRSLCPNWATLHDRLEGKTRASPGQVQYETTSQQVQFQQNAVEVM